MPDATAIPTTLEMTSLSIYFSDEETANQDDLVLRSVPPKRRQTLTAQLVPGTDPKEYRFDIKFQGDDETVFFDF